MSSENYINLYFSDDKIRLTVLTNICRMLVKRGYMNIDKYTRTGTNKEVNTKRIIIEQPSANDDIDNTLFMPFIETRVDTNTYIIPLDIPYRDQRESKSEGNIEFDGLSVIIKLVPQVVKDISNSPILNDFLKTYNKNHKIIVFDGMADKVYNTLNRKKNVEVFDRDSLMIDLMSHVSAPVDCQLVTETDLTYITNLKIAKILENDPLCRYYNGKRGTILRIIRPSLNNSVETVYRKIIEPRSVFK